MKRASSWWSSTPLLLVAVALGVVLLALSILLWARSVAPIAAFVFALPAFVLWPIVWLCWPSIESRRRRLRQGVAVVFAGLSLPFLSLAAITLWTGGNDLEAVIEREAAQLPKRMIVLCTVETARSGVLAPLLAQRARDGLRVETVLFQGLPLPARGGRGDKPRHKLSDQQRQAHADATLGLHRELNERLERVAPASGERAYLLVVASHAELPALAFRGPQGLVSCDLPMLETARLRRTESAVWHGFYDSRRGIPLIEARGAAELASLPVQRWADPHIRLVAGRLPFGADELPLLKQAVASTLRYGERPRATAKVLVAGTRWAVKGDSAAIQTLTARGVAALGGRATRIADAGPADILLGDEGFMEAWRRVDPDLIYSLTHGSSLSLSGLVSWRDLHELSPPPYPSIFNASGCSTGRPAGRLVRGFFRSGTLAAFVGFSATSIPLPPLAAVNSEVNAGSVGAAGLPLGCAVRAASASYAEQGERSVFDKVKLWLVDGMPFVRGVLDERFGSSVVERHLALSGRQAVSHNLLSLVLYGDPSMQVGAPRAVPGLER